MTRADAAGAAPGPTGRSVLPVPALLFVPGDRPDRFAKAAERADGVILDLEDAVSPAHKDQARAAVAESRLDPARTIVRINGAGTPEHDADLAMVRASTYRMVMLPKADAAGCATLPDLTLVALLESARGLRDAEAVAELPQVLALMWGAEDLVADLGGSGARRPDGGYRDVARHARSRTLVAAVAAGKLAIDAVRFDVADTEAQRREAEDAVASGFAATCCIHPAQAEVVRRAYAPAPEAVTHAEAVLAAAREHGEGVFRLGDEMVDGPVLRQCQQVLRRAGRSS